MSTQHPSSGRSLKRWLAWIAASLALLGFIMAGAAWWLIESLDIKKVVSHVEQALEEVTGRKVTIGSEPQFSFTPLLKLVVRDVKIGNMESGSRPEMLKLDRLEIGISLTPLLEGGRPGLNITLIDPDLLLEASEQGERNWILKLSPEEALARLKKAIAVLEGRISLDAVRIERATVRLDDRREHRAITLTALSATLELKKADDYELALDAALNGRPIAIRAGFRLPEPGAPMPASMKASLPGANLSAEGLILPAWPTTGTDVKVTLEIHDSSQLGDVLGIKLVKLPAGRLEARLLGGEQHLRADPLRLSLGRSEMTGSVELLRFKPRPHINMTANAPVIDLSELMPATGTHPETSKDGRIFPEIKVPLDLLLYFDTNSRLTVERLILHGTQSVEKVEAGVSLMNGRLAVAPLSMNAASGRMSGRVRIETRSPQSASIDVELNLKEARLGALLALADAPGANIKDAKTDIALRLSSSGNSVRTWIAGLNGQARIVIGPGTVPGDKVVWGSSMFGTALDLINPFREKDGGGQLKCAVVNVPVRTGIVTVQHTIAAETDKVVGSVSGTADLRQERLDLVLHSKAVEGLGPGVADFASAVKMTGSFARPELAVHAQGAAAAGLKIGAGVATFGVSILAESLLRKASPPHPCRTALEAKP